MDKTTSTLSDCLSAPAPAPALAELSGPAAGALAAVDAGASRCRCIVLDASGRLMSSATGPGAAFSPARATTCCETIRRCISEAAEKADVPLPLAGLSLAVAGIGREAHRRAFLHALRPASLAHVVVATHDAEAALWGAIPTGLGIVVIAGTGAIAFGRNSLGRTARAGGWGREIDDEGGAWWLATRVLAAVLRAHDRRGPQTSLTAAALAATGCADPEDLITWLRHPARSAKEVARLALLADDAARAGDPVAADLIASAAAALVEMAIACWRQLGPERPDRLACLGGLFAASSTLRDEFVRRLSAQAPTLRIVPARLPPVFGAVVHFWHKTGRQVTPELLGRLEDQLAAPPGDWGYERRR